MIAILLLFVALAQPPLPASVYADLASTKRTVVIPAGRWSLAPGKELRPARSNVLIDARGATFVPDSAVSLPLNVISQVSGGLIYYGTPDGRRHAHGPATARTTSFAVEDTAGIQAGDVVLLRLGVNVGDPNEPEFICYRRITSVSGKTVRFTPALGKATTVYQSYDALRALVYDDPSQRDKVGPWGVMPSGRIGRGLGASHDLYCFQSGKPIENMIVDGLTIEWPENARTYGVASFSAGYARSVVYRNCKVRDPAGSVLHLTCCESSGAESLEISGEGRARWFADSAIAPAVGFSQWSGIDCFLRHVHADCGNFYLTNFEAAIERTQVENVTVLSGKQTYPVAQLGSGSYRNIVLDLPPGSPITYYGSQVENLTLVRDEVPSWLPVAGLTGTVRIGKRKFGPLTKIDLPLVTDGPSFRIPRHDGLYKLAKIVLESREGIAAIGDPNNVFGTEGLVLPLRTDFWSSVRPGTIEDYYAALQCVVYGRAGVKFRFQAEYLPEQGGGK